MTTERKGLNINITILDTKKVPLCARVQDSSWDVELSPWVDGWCSAESRRVELDVLPEVSRRKKKKKMENPHSPAY